MVNPDTDNTEGLDPRLAKAEELLERGNVAAACNEYFLYAGDRLADGHIQEAIEYYKKIDGYGCLDIDGRIQLAGMYVAVNDIPEAINGYTRIAEDYLTQGLPEKAVEIYKKAVDNVPEQEGLTLKLAELYVSLGRPSKALKVYLDVLKESPENTEVL
ncbi:MAG: tetratricopeptide repeat protein, partial [bacterium]|nr:tetratricopeptide repeat protein [bacterium]